MSKQIQQVGNGLPLAVGEDAGPVKPYAAGTLEAAAMTLPGPEAPAATDAAPLPTPPADEEEHKGPPPIDRRLLAVLPRNLWVELGSDRYLTSSYLPRAFRWGQILYGGRSWVILERKAGTGGAPFLVVPTKERLHREEFRLGKKAKIDGNAVQLVDGDMKWYTTFNVPGNPITTLYAFRVLVTVEGTTFFPRNTDLIKAFYADLKAGEPITKLVDPAVARDRISEELTALPEAKAAERLAELDEEAFGLFTWEERVKFLEVLARNGSGKDRDAAMLAIFKAVGDRAELDAAMATLRKHKTFDQVFEELDNGLFDLLVNVGERFGEGDAIALDDLVVMAKAVGYNMQPLPVAIQVTDDGVEIDLVAVRQLKSLVRTVFRGTVGTVRDLLFTIEHTEEMVAGLGELGMLISTIYKAKVQGDPDSRQMIDAMLEMLGQKAMHAWQGAKVLGCSHKVLEKYYWSILWNLATFFLSVLKWAKVAKVKSLAALGAISRFAVRFSRLRGLIQESRFPRLQRLMSLMSARAAHWALLDEEKLLGALVHLPDQPFGKFAGAVDEYDVPDSVKELEHLPTGLAAIATDTLKECDLIQLLADRSGGLPGEVAELYRRLRGVFPL